MNSCCFFSVRQQLTRQRPFGDRVCIIHKLRLENLEPAGLFGRSPFANTDSRHSRLFFALRNWQRAGERPHFTPSVHGPQLLLSAAISIQTCSLSHLSSWRSCSSFDGVLAELSGRVFKRILERGFRHRLPHCRARPRRGPSGEEQRFLSPYI